MKFFAVFAVFIAAVAAATDLIEIALEHKEKLATVVTVGLSALVACRRNGQLGYCGHMGIISATGTSMLWDTVANWDDIVDYAMNFDLAETLADGLHGLKEFGEGLYEVGAELKFIVKQMLSGDTGVYVPESAADSNEAANDELEGEDKDEL